MATEVASAVFAVVRLLYATVQQVQGNRKQARFLYERVDAIVASVQAFDVRRLALPETEKALEFLLRVVSDANSFLTDFRDAGRLRRIVFKGGHSERFADLHVQLTHAAQALSLGVTLTTSALQLSAQQANARAQDDIKDKVVLGVWGIAPRLTKFVGRAHELAQLDRQLWPSAARMSATGVVISGLGGTGKSTLAQWAAQLHADRFTSGWVLDGSTLDTLRASLRQVAKDLDVDDVNVETLPDVIRTRLSQADRAGWLVVVDNVDAPQFAARLLDFLPRVGGCLLVTSRLASWDGQLWQVLHLGTMDTADAIRVLQGEGIALTNALENGAGVPSVSAPADDFAGPAALAAADPLTAIAKRLDGLPLALAQAKAYVRQHRVGWSYYNDKLATEASAVLAYGETGALPSLRLSLAAALAEGPSVGILLQLLRLLHPDAIPRSLLVDALSRAVASTGLVIRPGEPDDAALTILADYSVITLTEETVSLHRLMQDTITSVVPCERACVLALAAALRNAGEQGILTNRGNGVLPTLVPHYRQLLPSLERSFPESLELAEVLAPFGVAMQHASYMNDESIVHLRRAVAIMQVHLPETDPRLIFNQCMLALCLTNVVELEEGINIARRTLQLVEARVADNAFLLALARHTLGIYDYYFGAPMIALERLQAALAGFGDHDDGNRMMVTFATVFISYAHGALGQPKLQLAAAEGTLNALERHLGQRSGASAYYAAALQNAGDALGALGDAEGHMRYCERAHEIMTRMFSPRLLLAIDVAMSRAAAYGGVGQVTQQLHILERAHAAAITYHGGRNIMVVRLLVRLADVYGTLARREQQLSHATAAVEMAADFFPEASLETARARAALGDAEQARGRSDHAVAHLQFALGVFVAFFGDDHIQTAAIRVRLAQATPEKHGDTRRALLERALAVQTGYYPRSGDHPEVAKTLYLLAILPAPDDDTRYGNIPRTQQLERALATFERHYTGAHIDIGLVLVQLAKAGASEQLRWRLERAVGILDDVYGPDNSLSVEVRQRLEAVRAAATPTAPDLGNRGDLESTKERLDEPQSRTGPEASRSSKLKKKHAPRSSSNNSTNNNSGRSGAEAWSAEDVTAWLQQLALDRPDDAIAAFIDEGIRGRHLPLLTSERLKEFGLRGGDRLVILDARDRLLAA